MADMKQSDLAAKAKAEHKAAQAARKAGGDVPPTPHLDELTRRNEAGEAPARRKAEAKVTPVFERPATRKGWSILELRTPEHGEVVSEALVDGSFAKVTGPYLEVKNSAAQRIFDALVDEAGSEDPVGGMYAPEFRRRIHQVTSLQVRSEYPKVKDPRTALPSRLTTHLNEAGVEWSPGWAKDGSMAFDVKGTHYSSVRKCAKAMKVETTYSAPEAKAA
jgi:hypothetical protein